jgi:hypothetical protein
MDIAERSIISDDDNMSINDINTNQINPKINKSYIKSSFSQKDTDKHE